MHSAIIRNHPPANKTSHGMPSAPAVFIALKAGPGIVLKQKQKQNRKRSNTATIDIMAICAGPAFQQSESDLRIYEEQLTEMPFAQSGGKSA